MSDPRDVHRLRRSLGQLTIDAVDARLAAAREASELAPGDMVQHIQLEVGGQAAATVGFNDFEVYWPNPFLNDVARGDVGNDLDNPNLATGIELTSDDPVLTQVQLRRWLRDESSLIVGAQMRFLVWSPSDDPMHAAQYKATLHLSFIGYAAPADPDDNDDEADD
jgi:hypothetical protein